MLGSDDGCDVGQIDTEGASEGLELGWLLGLSVTITTVGVPNVICSTVTDGKSSTPSSWATVAIVSAIAPEEIASFMFLARSVARVLFSASQSQVDGSPSSAHSNSCITTS